LKDNILLWLGDEFTYFGMANFLQNKLNCNLYGIFDTERKEIKDFFQNQKLINFSKLWSYQDHTSKIKEPDMEYLESFEKKYKINLWDIAYSERYFYSEFNPYHKFTKNEILSIIEQECRFFDNVLDEVKPSYFMATLISRHHKFLLYKLCRSRGIKFLTWEWSRFGGRWIVSSEIARIDKPEDYVNTKSDFFKTNDDLMDYLENNPLPISYSDGAKYKTEKQKKIISLLKFLITPIDKNLDSTYLQYGKTKTNMLTKGSRSLQSRKRKKIESYMADNLTTKIDSTIPFLYFPLHLEPERELLIQSPFLTNQISVITNISKVLPVNYQLYVKEHPAMRSNGWRSVDYYSNLQNLPNVTLIHPSVNSKELIEKCSLVVTIAGDTALEAAFFNKPSIVFTNTDFSVLPFVFHVEDFKNLKETIRVALDSEVNFDHLKKYVSYVNENSFEFDYLTIRADFNNIIYYPGFLGKIDISEDNVKQFIEKHSSAFSKLADEHIKKIN
tara:strand:- start:90 stop:1589 length:1500 start_codon:yes stop_codon:yes gene_type:complete